MLAKLLKILEARVGIEPTHKGFADLSLTTWVPRLGLGLPASALLDCRRSVPQAGFYLERETGVEPATSSLARKHSTTELLPLYRFKYNDHVQYGQRGVTCCHNCDSLF